MFTDIVWMTAAPNHMDGDTCSVVINEAVYVYRGRSSYFFHRHSVDDRLLMSSVFVQEVAHRTFVYRHSVDDSSTSPHGW